MAQNRRRENPNRNQSRPAQGNTARRRSRSNASGRRRVYDQAQDAREQARTTGATAVATSVTTKERLSGGRIFMALFPYLLVIVVFSLAKLWPPLRDGLTATDVPIEWRGLYGNVLNLAGEPSSSTVYNFSWLSNPGTLLLICTVIAAGTVPPSAASDSAQ